MPDFMTSDRRPKKVESCSRWFEKAQAAWSQLRPDMTDEEVFELFAEVGPVPRFKHYREGKSGTVPEDQWASFMQSSTINTLRNFKKIVGDSKACLGTMVRDDNLLLMYAISDVGNSYNSYAVATFSPSRMVGEFTLYYNTAVFTLDNRGLGEAYKENVLDKFKTPRKWASIPFQLIYTPIAWVYGYVRNIAHPSWRVAWLQCNSIRQVCSNFSGTKWPEFFNLAVDRMGDAFRKGTKGLSASRGTTIQQSVGTGGGAANP